MGRPTDSQLDLVRRMVVADGGLAVVSTLRPDGSIQSSVVKAGMMNSPSTNRPCIAYVALGGSRKLVHLRRDQRTNVVFRAGWDWVSIEGMATLLGPDDRLEGIEASSIPQILRDVFTAAGGTHDDWVAYDRVMAEERRTAVFVGLDRVSSNA